jgi:hypothetical protein
MCHTHCHHPGGAVTGEDATGTQTFPPCSRCSLAELRQLAYLPRRFLSSIGIGGLVRLVSVSASARLGGTAAVDRLLGGGSALDGDAIDEQQLVEETLGCEARVVRDRRLDLAGQPERGLWIASRVGIVGNRWERRLPRPAVSRGSTGSDDRRARHSVTVSASVILRRTFCGGLGG